MMALKTTKRHQHQPKKTATKKPSLEPQINTVKTFTQHVQELRGRLFWVALAAIVISALVYAYQGFFLNLIMKPLGSQKLIYLTPGGGFAFIFSVTLYVTMIIILPFVLYQLYAFIRPAIPRHASRLSLKVALAAFLLMAIGVSFGYFYAVPSGLNFLTNFATDYVTPSLTADSYLNFVMGYIFGIGALFELPLLLLFWHWISPLTPKKLLTSERYIIVVAFILAAIISPTPDAFNQIVIALPIIIVYQLGVVAVLLSIRNSRRAAERDAREQEEIDSYQPFDIDIVQPIEPVNKIADTVPVEASPSRLVPVASHATLRPGRAMSIDGVVGRGVRKSTASLVGQYTPINQTVANRNRVVAPSRGRLIRDIGPISR